MKRKSQLTLMTAILLREGSLVAATAGPIFAEFCPSIMDGWLCNRNPSMHWLENTCDDSETNNQLEILAEFYFETGNRASSGPLFEMGWLSDCEFCNWEGIACNDDGEIIAIEVGKQHFLLSPGTEIKYLLCFLSAYQVKLTKQCLVSPQATTVKFWRVPFQLGSSVSQV